MNPILSFIIIEYFSLEEVAKCIETISSSAKDIPYEIIISSNSQYPEEKQAQLPVWENTRWVFNSKNGGFAYGMNRGLDVAKGKYRVIMNPDVKILSDLSPMIEFMDNNLDVGAIAPKVVNENGEIQDSCRPYVSLQSFLYRLYRRITEHTTAVLSNDFDYTLTQTVDWVIGAFIMVRDNIAIETGGLDEHYFMYAEDLDWCTRIRKLSYEIVYFPEVVIEYMGSRYARWKFKYACIFTFSHLRYWRKFGLFSGYPIRTPKNWQS